MADDITTMTVIDATLKNNQTAKAVVKQYDRSSQLTNKIGMGSGFWSDTGIGRQYIQPIETEPQAAYTRLVTDARADATTGQTRSATYDPRSYIESPIHLNFDAAVRADGTGPSEAFVKSLAKLVTGAGEAIGSEKNRQTFSATGTSTLCGVAITTGALDGNVITFTDENWEKIVKRDYVTINLKLDVFTASSGVPTNAEPLYTSRKVTAITKSSSVDASTITLDGPAMTTAADGAVAIAVAGNRVYSGGTSASREITSLHTITDNTSSSTVGGLTSTTTHRWTGNVYDNSAGSGNNTAFSAAGYMAALEMIESRVGPEAIENAYAFCDRTRFNHALLALGNATNQAVRYGKTSEVEAKFTNEIPLAGGTSLVPERQAPPNEIMVISLNHLEYVNPHPKEINWVEGGGGTRVHWDNNHGWVGMPYWNGDLVTDCRGAHVRLRYVL